MATRSCPYDSDETRRALDLHWRAVDSTLADSIRWLVRAGQAIRNNGGTLIAFERIPAEDVQAVLDSSAE